MHKYNNDSVFRENLNNYYDNKLLLQEQKEQLNILTV